MFAEPLRPTGVRHGMLPKRSGVGIGRDSAPHHGQQFPGCLRQGPFRPAFLRQVVDQAEGGQAIEPLMEST